MWGLGTRDDGTIASLLARCLAADRIGARVGIHAQIGWVSTQSTLDLMLDLRAGRAPDMVVFYDGCHVSEEGNARIAAAIHGDLQFPAARK